PARQELEDLAPVQAHQLQQQVADLPLPHDQRDVAVRSGQHLRRAVAASLELDVAVDPPEAALDDVGVANELGQLEPARMQVHFADRRVGVAVDAQRSRQGAAGDSELHGVEVEHAVLQAHAQVEAV